LFESGSSGLGGYYGFFGIGKNADNFGNDQGIRAKGIDTP
jgi:hypothetical protein